MNKQLVKVIFYLILFFLILFIFNQFLISYYIRLISLLGINIILAITLALTNGYTGVFSLGHAAFMAIGAYVSTILTLPINKKYVFLSELPSSLMNIQVNFIFSLIIGGIIAFLFAALIGSIVLRLKGHYLALSTLGFMVIVRSILINATKYTNGAKGISNIPNHANLFVIYIFLLVFLYICYRIINSHYGRAMKAIRENDVAAETFGINPFYYRLLAFCIGAFGAAFAGGLWAFLITTIAPNSFSYSTTFDIISMIIIGGSGSLSGCIIGSVIITLFPELLRSIETGGIVIFGYQIPVLFGMSQIILAIIVIMILIYKPGGIMGYKEVILPDFIEILKVKTRKKNLIIKEK